LEPKNDGSVESGDSARTDNPGESADGEENGKAALKLARAALEKRDFEQAVKLSQQAKAAGAPAAQCMEVELAAKADGGNRGDVLLELDSILARMNNPESAPLWALQARLFYEKNDIDRALNSIRMATRLAPQNTTYMQREARILWAKQQVFEALHVWRLRSTADPLNVEARLDYAQALVSAAQSVNTKDSELALRLLANARRATHEVCALKPDWPNGWETLCRIAIEAQKSHGTRSDFNREAARYAYKGLLQAYKGDVSKVPADLTSLGGL
jgi:predicted Zn-dependent protease